VAVCLGTPPYQKKTVPRLLEMRKLVSRLTDRLSHKVVIEFELTYCEVAVSLVNPFYDLVSTKKVIKMIRCLQCYDPELALQLIKCIVYGEEIK
jgi:hypothetical protein